MLRPQLLGNAILRVSRTARPRRCPAWCAQWPREAPPSGRGKHRRTSRADAEADCNALRRVVAILARSSQNELPSVEALRVAADEMAEVVQYLVAAAR